MKTFTLIITFLMLTNIGLFGQSGMTIRSGGAVTVNGNTIINNPFVCGDPLTDTRDGKTYSTVLIGTQCWMAQNLNIGTKVLGSTDQTNNSIIEKYCYNDDDVSCNVYGGLYQWDEAMQYTIVEGAQGICPSGWHLPTDAEWTALTTYLGGEAVAGGKMKEAGTMHWASPNTGATNSSGFTALPGGKRKLYLYGSFLGLADSATFWSSSQDILPKTGNRHLLPFTEYVGRNLQFINAYLSRTTAFKTEGNGLSVRCVKD